ncbi:uncharacterized protein BDCG_00620 [Blastomyces dermatitidis ER-3]|uniref:Uncharacterized protein n=1 Tax=Ajellomyces dermatitidis (strain ER-3 / ATCC MYA-2586) TaxID=559297 RepID=A0ABP2EKU9_AJEDR|nr:uncharacterized protein BDCG_00620 [Blastomyces dermatitidis ER-3]EEQ83815.2 hypothetical protein BDCG_00620 [Blastomyces dermatitidis ER-3]
MMLKMGCDDGVRPAPAEAVKQQTRKKQKNSRSDEKRRLDGDEKGSQVKSRQVKTRQGKASSYFTGEDDVDQDRELMTGARVYLTKPGGGRGICPGCCVFR